MAPRLLVEHAALDGARVLIDPDALSQYEARGWTAVGPCSDHTRDPLRTDAEWELFAASEAARIAAVMAPPKSSPGAAAAASKKPARAAAES